MPETAEEKLYPVSEDSRQPQFGNMPTNLIKNSNAEPAKKVKTN